MSTKTQKSKGDYFKNREKETLGSHSLEVVVPFPKNALIELNSSCNHACVFCTNPRMNRKSSSMSVELFELFIQEAVSLGLSEVGFYTTGEPLMHKNITEFISIAHKAGVPYIYITTNGALASLDKIKKLIDSGLNSIKFSINAGTSETYKLIHGRDDFDTVLMNLRTIKDYIVENELKVRLLSSFIATKYSEHEVDQYAELISPLVDDYAVIGIGPQGGQSLAELNALRSELSLPAPELGTAKPCGMLWSRLHLTQEGYFSLCCIDYENNLIYSKYEPGKLLESWNSETMQSMRQKMLDQRLEGTLCHNCLYSEEKEFTPLMELDFPQKDSSRSRQDVWNRITILSQRRSPKTIDTLEEE